MKVGSTSLVTLALAAEIIVGASALSPQSSAPAHRRGLARKLRRAVGWSNEEHHTLQKRDFHGTGTFYGAGVSMGACGHWSDPADNVVALNIGLYGNPSAQSKWCGQQVRITSGGVSATATIVDCCPTCPGNGDLDMSKALFQQFGDLNQGVLDISWHFGGGDGGGSGTGSSSNSNSNSNNNNNDNKNQQKNSPKTTATPTSSTQMVTQTLLSTLTSTSASASTATGTGVTASTVTAPDPTSTANPDGDVQNLAVLGQALQGMFNMANAVQS